MMRRVALRKRPDLAFRDLGPINRRDLILSVRIPDLRNHGKSSNAKEAQNGDHGGLPDARNIKRNKTTSRQDDQAGCVALLRAHDIECCHALRSHRPVLILLPIGGVVAGFLHGAPLVAGERKSPGSLPSKSTTIRW